MIDPVNKTKVASPADTRPKKTDELLGKPSAKRRHLATELRKINTKTLAELTLQIDTLFSKFEATHTIYSHSLGNHRSIWIYKPENGSAISNLVVFLDGELFLKQIDALSVIERVTNENEMANSLFVFVSMHSQAARMIECSCNLRFSKFIAEELIEFLEVVYPEMKKVQQRVLAGVSFSGLAAVFTAAEFPGAFQKVIAQSGSFWWKDSWLIKHLSKKTKPLASSFYLDVGTMEIEVDAEGDPRENTFQSTSQIDSVNQIRDALVTQGCLVNYVEFSGGHEAKEWEKTLPGALIWAGNK